jgi:pyruvate/2-oxoglutarate dehydrogenase complex dihydrolipoamide acyltransferase (E2) component
MGNLALVRKKNPSVFRRLAIGTWRTSYDPAVYGALTVRMEEALRYMEAFREHTGRRVTVTHLMARAVAAVFEKMPDANAILRGSRLYLRKDIAVFFQIVLEDPVTGEIDLSGMVLRKPETKTLAEIVDECEERIAKVKAHKDQELAKSRGLMSRLPGFLIAPMLRFTSWLSYGLNLRVPGVPRDAFGSIMITNIGSIGLEEAYVPLVPYSRVPILLAVGAIEDTVAVEAGAIVPAKRMKICATFDHRVLDGAHAAVMAKTLRAWFERPFEHFDPLPAV